MCFLVCFEPQIPVFLYFLNRKDTKKFFCSKKFFFRFLFSVISCLLNETACRDVILWYP